ncbi:MAG: TetR/AcrR family transcriptional regulator [Cyanobacteria bacterium J06636_16]
MVRNKEETKARILAAVGKLLAESGFQQLGVNAIAREAGVDKVLIYRYFEGLPNLLQRFASEGGYWPTLQELLGDESSVEADTLTDWMLYLLLGFMHDLRARPISQEILRWELLEENELTRELASVRDRTAMASLRFLSQKGSVSPDKDIFAIGAVLIAGVVYLTLRAKANDTFMDIDFSSPVGWQRIEDALESIIRSTFHEL